MTAGRPPCPRDCGQAAVHGLLRCTAKQCLSAWHRTDGTRHASSQIAYCLMSISSKLNEPSGVT